MPGIEHHIRHDVDEQLEARYRDPSINNKGERNKLKEELHHHLERFARPGPDSHVFTTGEGAPIERSNFRLQVWLPATQQVGLGGLRFHDLRHTAGTPSARTGATTKEIMARLGHASARAAMVYQHATEDRDRLIADRLTLMAEEAGLVPRPPAVSRAARPRREPDEPLSLF